MMGQRTPKVPDDEIWKNTFRNTYYRLPVVLCTAYPAFKDDLKSIAADYYVLKSSDLKELKSKIKMALEGEMQMPSAAPHSEDNKTKPIAIEPTGHHW